MKDQLNQNLGLADARDCNTKFGANLELQADKLTAGSVIELPQKAVDFLNHRYPVLLNDVRTLSGVSETPKVKGVGEAKTADRDRRETTGAST